MADTGSIPLESNSLQRNHRQVHNIAILWPNANLSLSKGDQLKQGCTLQSKHDDACAAPVTFVLSFA